MNDSLLVKSLPYVNAFRDATTRRARDEAFAKLARLWRPTIRREMAGDDDHAQEALISLWNCIDQYDPSHGGSFTGFALTFMWRRRSTLRRHARAEKRGGGREVFDITDELTEQVPADTSQTQTDDRDHIDWLASKAFLTPREIDILKLKYLEGLTAPEIATRLDLTARGVDSTLNRTRARLREVAGVSSREERLAQQRAWTEAYKARHGLGVAA